MSWPYAGAEALNRYLGWPGGSMQQAGDQQLNALYASAYRNVANDPDYLTMLAHYAQQYRPPEQPITRAERLAKIGVYEIAPSP